MRKSLNKAPAMFCQPAECIDLGKSLWLWELLYCTYIFSAGMDPFMGYVMHQVYNLQLEKLTLGGFQLQIEFPEALKHDEYALQVFLF